MSPNIMTRIPISHLRTYFKYIPSSQVLHTAGKITQEYIMLTGFPEGLLQAQLVSVSPHSL